VVHQRTGTRLPTLTEMFSIQKALDLPKHPEDKSVPNAGVDRSKKVPWRSVTSPEDQKKFTSELTTRLNVVIDEKYKSVEWKLLSSAQHVTVAQLAGAEKAAVQVVDRVLAGWLANTFLSTAQRKEQVAKKFVGDGTAVVDASDAALRKKLGHPVNGWDMILYFAKNDETAGKIMAAAKIDPYEGAFDDTDFLLDEILKPIFKTREKTLDDCDRLGYFSTRPRLGKVVADLSIDTSGGQKAEVVVMERQYEVFQKLVHEYIHTLEHPVIPGATNESLAFREGICEWMTIQILAEIATWTDRELYDLTTVIESKVLSEAKRDARGQALRRFLSTYQAAPDYARYVTGARQVIDTVGVGANALYAAYIQGHVEYLGLTAYGTWDFPAVESGGARSTCRMPPLDSGSTVAAIAPALQISADELARLNPPLTAKGHLGDGHPHLFLPGFHGTSPVTDGSETESWDLIAVQNGVAVDRLRATNGPEGLKAAPEGWVLVPDMQ